MPGALKKNVVQPTPNISSCVIVDVVVMLAVMVVVICDLRIQGPLVRMFDFEYLSIWGIGNSEFGRRCASLGSGLGSRVCKVGLGDVRMGRWS